MPNLTAFIAGMGTSGTLMGMSKKLKEYNKKIQIIGVEPNLGHKIMGLKNMKECVVPKVYDEIKLDKKVVIADEDAFRTARQLATQEGIFVGMSSGASMRAAIEQAMEMKEGKIVVLLPDRGDRYASTPLYKV
jgi:cysteine synthase B